MKSTPMIRPAYLVLTLGLFGFGFAGCSSDDSPSQPSTNAAGPATSTVGSQSTSNTSTTSSTTGATVTSTTTSTSAAATTTTGTTTTGAGGATTTAATVTGSTTDASTSTTGGACPVAGQLDCGSGCQDVMSDAANCGACGMPCGEGISCVSGQCEGGCATLAGAIDRDGSYVLEFGDTYFAAQAAGGKIIEFRRAGGSNLFTGPSANETNFGSTLWTAPQADWDWPPPTAVDSEAYTVAVDDAAATITMVSNGTPTPGPDVTVTKVFAADLCANAIDITYTVTNNGAAADEFAPWEVTRVQPGGLTFFGAQEGLLAGSTLTAQYETDTYWFDHMVDSTGDLKLFAEATQGYVAYTQGTDLFVKAFMDVPTGAHPPDHGEIEVYEDTNDGYVEVEVIGANASVAAGASTSMHVRWFVRPMPDGATRTVGDAALKAAAVALASQ